MYDSTSVRLCVMGKYAKVMDEKLKATSHENVYMPMFIPESLLQKEKDQKDSLLK